MLTNQKYQDGENVAKLREKEIRQIELECRSVHLDTVMEYLAAEVLEFAGNTARDNKN